MAKDQKKFLKLLERLVVTQEAKKIRPLFQYMEDKFQKGKKEHSNDLSDMSQEQLVREALDEAIDQVFYLNELLNKINNKERK